MRLSTWRSAVADRVKHPPVSDGDRAVEFRLIGTPADLQAWLDLFAYVADIKIDSGLTRARRDGHARRYVRAELKEI